MWALAADPALQPQLRARCQGAVGDHGEEVALDIDAVLAVAEQAAEHVADADAAPQCVEDVAATEGEAALDVELGDVAGQLGLDGGALGRLQEAAQTADEATELGLVDLIGAAEVVEDLVARLAAVGIPHLVRELEVVDPGAVLALAGDAADVHAHIVGV